MKDGLLGRGAYQDQGRAGHLTPALTRQRHQSTGQVPMDGQQYIHPTPTLSDFKTKILSNGHIYEIHVHSDVDGRTRDVRDDSRTERERARHRRGGVKVTVRPWTCTAGRAKLPGLTVRVLQTEMRDWCP